MTLAMTGVRAWGRSGKGREDSNIDDSLAGSRTGLTRRCEDVEMEIRVGCYKLLYSNVLLIYICYCCMAGS